jgi:hypothetical protein
VIAVIVVMQHHSHHLKLEITTSVTELMNLIPFGLEKAVQVTIHAVHSYFSVQLPAATTDRIELRICTDQGQADEIVLVLFAEIYV